MFLTYYLKWNYIQTSTNISGHKEMFLFSCLRVGVNQMATSVEQNTETHHFGIFNKSCMDVFHCMNEISFNVVTDNVCL